MKRRSSFRDNKWRLWLYWAASKRCRLMYIYSMKNLEYVFFIYGMNCIKRTYRSYSIDHIEKRNTFAANVLQSHNCIIILNTHICVNLLQTGPLLHMCRTRSSSHYGSCTDTSWMWYLRVRMGGNIWTEVKFDVHICFSIQSVVLQVQRGQLPLPGETLHRCCSHTNQLLLWRRRTSASE